MQTFRCSVYGHSVSSNAIREERQERAVSLDWARLGCLDVWAAIAL